MTCRRGRRSRPGDLVAPTLMNGRRRASPAGGDLLADARRSDHQDVLRRNLLPQWIATAGAASGAARWRRRAWRVPADDVLVQLATCGVIDDMRTRAGENATLTAVPFYPVRPHEFGTSRFFGGKSFLAVPAADGLARSCRRDSGLLAGGRSGRADSVDEQIEGARVRQDVLSDGKMPCSSSMWLPFRTVQAVRRLRAVRISRCAARLRPAGRRRLGMMIDRQLESSVPATVIRFRIRPVVANASSSAPTSETESREVKLQVASPVRSVP